MNFTYFHSSKWSGRISPSTYQLPINPFQRFVRFLSDHLHLETSGTTAHGIWFCKSSSFCLIPPLIMASIGSLGYSSTGRPWEYKIVQVSMPLVLPNLPNLGRKLWVPAATPSTSTGSSGVSTASGHCRDPFAPLRPHDERFLPILHQDWWLGLVERAEMRQTAPQLGTRGIMIKYVGFFRLYCVWLYRIVRVLPFICHLAPVTCRYSSFAQEGLHMRGAKSARVTCRFSTKRSKSLRP